jgi:phosphomannomutase
MDTSAISFGTDGWRATLDSFTDDRVRAVGRAVAAHLVATEPGGEVVVGYDARETSEGFAESLADELAAAGFDAVLPERDRPTPVVAWSVVDRGARGALMVTASHNPPEYNGVKFVPDDGAPALPAVTDDVEARLGESPPAPAEPGSVARADLFSPYADHARALVDADLSGLTVAYDAIHGSGRGATDALLESLGADVVRLRCDRDPTFGDTHPEPSAANLAALTERVRSGDADLGVANDGDADRVALVAPDHGFLDGNRVLAVLYDHLLDVRDESGPVVRTVSTTFLLDRIAEAHGERAVETPVGFKWVAEAMREHDALAGGEESGGHAVRGHVREKDGVLLAGVLAAAAAAESLDDRLDRLAADHGAVVADRVGVDCPDDAKARVIDSLGDAIPETVAGRDVADVVTLDGFKLLLADGSWLLVRPSGTEPKMRVYAEGTDEDAVADILAEGRALVERLTP